MRLLRTFTALLLADSCALDPAKEAEALRLAENEHEPFLELGLRGGDENAGFYFLSE